MTIASLNLWYIAAIVFGALTAFCGYYGSILESRRSSNDQSSRIESQLEDLAGELKKAKAVSGDVESSEAVAQIEDRYDELAAQFFKNLPIRAANYQSERASQEALQLESTSKVRGIFEALLDECQAIEKAFNQQSTQNIFLTKSSPPPGNFFKEPAGNLTYIIFDFVNGGQWGAEFRLIEGKLMINFGQVKPELDFGEKHSYISMPDSISFILNEKTFSLISRGIEFERIVSGTFPNGRRDVGAEKLVELAATVMQRMTEHAIILGDYD